MFPCVMIQAQDNPFMKVAGEKYAGFIQVMTEEYQKIAPYDTVVRQKIINQLKEVAQKTGSKEWKMEVKYAEVNLYFVKCDMKNQWGNKKVHQWTDKEVQMYFDLLEEAKRANLFPLEIRIRFQIIDFYREKKINLKLAIDQCVIQADRLSEISSEEMPDKANMYINIVSAYLTTRDTPKAIYFLNKLLEEKDNYITQFAKQSARNDLGFLYSEQGELDRADSCYNAILHTDYILPLEENMRIAWEGIAESNLGNNMFQRGEYDKAIALFKMSIDKVMKVNDCGFATGLATNIADAYLRKGNLSEAKHYIDIALKYDSLKSHPSRLCHIYEVLSKYYASKGNIKLSMACEDSILQITKRNKIEYDYIQQFGKEEKEAMQKQQELVYEKAARRNVQIHLLIISAGFIIISSLFIALFYRYRKTRAVYRELVRKSQEWTQNAVELKPIFDENKSMNNCQLISDADRQLFEQLQQLFKLEHCYSDPAITIDKVAKRMKTNTAYLSRAINHCSGKNFNVFTNEYRIKEAVMMISNHSEKFSIEGIALEVGFNDRKTFYTAFRKITGLSPSAFRSHLQER